MLIKFTYVDSISGIPLSEAPSPYGPVFPTISGLKFDFANESAWPTEVPFFYGECDDTVDENARGILEILTREEYDSLKTSEEKYRNDRLIVSMKTQRNFLLSISDWTQLPDSPLSEADKAKWLSYRAELRDITSQDGFPQTIEWPKSPDELEVRAIG